VYDVAFFSFFSLQFPPPSSTSGERLPDYFSGLLHVSWVLFLLPYFLHAPFSSLPQQEFSVTLRVPGRFPHSPPSPQPRQAVFFIYWFSHVLTYSVALPRFCPHRSCLANPSPLILSHPTIIQSSLGSGLHSPPVQNLSDSNCDLLVPTSLPSHHDPRTSHLSPSLCVVRGFM